MLSFLIHGNQYMHSSIGGNIGLIVGSSFGTVGEIDAR
jgi:hypothetical protein